MAETRKKKERKKKENYFLRAGYRLVQVTAEVYYACYEVHEHDKWLRKKDRKHNLIHYAALDTVSSTGEEEIQDKFAESVEDTAILNISVVNLRKALALLPKEQRALIETLYLSNFGEGMTLREYSAQTGIPFTTVQGRKVKALAELKKLIEIYS
jgi:DNA-directed RNA polymerase specialized sigma24 family protein